MDHFPSPFPYAADVVICANTSLTQQERVILCMIMAGYSRKEMALKLFVSINTIKTHLQNIYRKLDVNTRSQAISRAHSLGLFPPSSRM